MIEMLKKMKILLIVTAALLVVSVLCLSVSLMVEHFGNSGEYVDFGGNNNKEESGKKPDKPVQTPQSDPGAKTGIVLPSATATKVYLGGVDATTKDITDDEDIKSAAMALLDMTDNRLVAGKNADVKIYPASMTKVMTLLVACENAKDPNAMLTVTADMISKYASGSNAGGSVAFEWKEGYQVTVEDALHLIIYQSDTFACWLIAEHVAGSEAEFVAMMNAKAVNELGLMGTHFTNCTGLFNAEHYTTAREMAAIMAAAMNNTAAATVLQKYDMYTVDIYKNGEAYDTQDMWSGWYTGRLEQYGYPKTTAYYAGKGSDIRIVSGKTGWEEVPTGCFVTAGVDTVTGRQYVCVQVGRIDKTQITIGSSTSTYDTRVMYQKYAKEPTT